MDGANKLDASKKLTYYITQSDLLLKELVDFIPKKGRVFEHLDKAFSSY